MTEIPEWYKFAMLDNGKRELPENRGPYIRSLIAQAHAGHEGDPWCAIFVNAKLEQAGIPGTKSASSQSFRFDHNFIKLEHPVLGAIAVFWRMARQSGLGHVGFYDSESQGYVNTLGGNEHDMVKKEPLIKNGNHFGLIGYWWPKSVPIVGSAMITTNTPIVAGESKVT